MQNTKCSRASHEAIKADAVQWVRLRYVGTQHFGDGGPSTEMRNCSCGSTLAIDVPAKAVA